MRYAAWMYAVCMKRQHTARIQHAYHVHNGRTKAGECLKNERGKSIPALNHEKLHPSIPLVFFFRTFHPFGAMVGQLAEPVSFSLQAIGSDPFAHQVSNG